MTALALPPPLQRWTEAAARSFLQPPDAPRIDFAHPAGEQALVPPRHLLARPQEPRRRLRRRRRGRGPGARRTARPRRRLGAHLLPHRSPPPPPAHRPRRHGHRLRPAQRGGEEDRRRGPRPRRDRRPHLRRPALPRRRGALSWVQATAFYGFAQAYSRYVRPLTLEEFDRFYAEGAPASHLYGTFDAPVFPGPLRPVQRLLVRAAVDLVPDWARHRLELAPDQGLRSWERPLVRSMGALADRLMLRDGPAVQSCPRLGLPAHHLYRG